MAQPIVRSLPSQVELLLRQFTQAPGVPFADVLDDVIIRRLVDRHGLDFRNSIYNPIVTLALFLGQAIDPDPSLRQAVARLAAQRQLRGLPAISADTGAYAKARQRLPEEILADLTRLVGHHVLAAAPQPWRWRGHDVKIVDGSTLSMPDTAANQAAYPQPVSQRPGVGFPLLRIVTLFSLSVGTVLDAVVGPYQGEQTGENTLLRNLRHNLNPGDVLLADRYFCSYFEIALLQQRGVHVVMRLHQRRCPDLRRGQRLGPGEAFVTWRKPRRPAWLDQESYDQLPKRLRVRLLRLRASDRRSRSRRLDIVTTLPPTRCYSQRAIANLYRQRWHAELDLRSLKTVMQMDVLRGQTPGIVRKEIWARLLAYNLIRKVMAQAAQVHHIEPRTISFKGALQTLNAFAPTLSLCRPGDLRETIGIILEAIAQHRVADRPGRLEPRCRKRRPKAYPLLTQPRAHARRTEIT